MALEPTSRTAPADRRTAIGRITDRIHWLPPCAAAKYTPRHTGAAWPLTPTLGRGIGLSVQKP
jgi:hypothetical protein